MQFSLLVATVISEVQCSANTAKLGLRGYNPCSVGVNRKKKFLLNTTSSLQGHTRWVQERLTSGDFEYWFLDTS